MPLLERAIPVIAVIAIILALGVAVEWSRRQKLRRWAQAQGGEFTAGSLLAGAAVPEAGAFDGSTRADATYSNVVRILRPEAVYVIARMQRRAASTATSTGGQGQSVSCDVCFIALTGVTLPEVLVFRPAPSAAPGVLPGVSDPRTPLTVPGARPDFAGQLQVVPVAGGGAPSPDSLARLLPEPVQAALVARRDILSTLTVRGSVVRLQAVGMKDRRLHDELLVLARELAAAWSGQAASHPSSP